MGIVQGKPYWVKSRETGKFVKVYPEPVEYTDKPAKAKYVHKKKK